MTGQAPADDRTGAVGFKIIQNLDLHLPMPGRASTDAFLDRT